MAAPPSSTSTLREWQTRALEAMESWTEGPFLVSAAPGAGKTRPALEVAGRLLRAGAISRVVIACPTTPLTRQWAQAAAALGLHLVPDANDLRPPRDFQGVSVTYARIASVATAWERQCTAGTLVIADEAHHLGEELAWGESFATAFRPAGRWLLLSGTPFRSDATPIPGVRYDADGVVVPDVTYTYADAVRDGVCRPVTFIPYDGTLQWQSGDDIIESSFDTILTAREASRRYRTAISTEFAEGLPRILRAAHDKLELVRSEGHPDAGGLVVAADGTHARQVAKVLHQVSGVAPTVVLHTDSRAHQKLDAFRRSRDRWIVAVNMVSEGVDIPRLRVGVYATAAKTPLIFRQIVGRFVRTIGGRPAEMSWLYLPADGLLRGHAAEVERELLHVLRLKAPGDEAAFDELRETKRETEKTDPLAFTALSADVAPQLALFGPPPDAPKAKPKPIAFPSAVDAEPEPAAPVPAYQRRARLREDRHRLVADLRRRDGRPYTEINAWVNKQVGVRTVEEATIEQLERSIELLFAELSGRSV